MSTTLTTQELYKLTTQELYKKNQKPTFTEIATESFFLKTIYQQWPFLDIENDLLIRK